MDPKLAVMSVFLMLCGSDEPPKRAADQAALKPFAGLVGEWKGTGQPQRGSARGAWTESADWAWKLTNESAGLAYASPKGKYLRSAVLRPAKAKGDFVLDAVLADGSKRAFSGKIGLRDALILTPANTLPARQSSKANRSSSSNAWLTRMNGTKPAV